MYAEYFGLAEAPFRVAPDPRFLWWSDQHKEAKQKIVYYINQGAGPIYLLADIGIGKTTIARRIVEELKTDQTRTVVYVFAPKLTTTNSFLRFVMDEFGVKTERSYANSLKNFQNYLIEQHEKGKSSILLVDEAQNMNRDMLLLIQHLFNFSTNTDFLLHMALFAQPELQPKLNRLRSLKSRLSLAKIKAFDLNQTKDMLQHRWTVAGGKELPFTSESIAEIYRQTEGIPRLIVRLADEALVRTVVNQQQEVNKNNILAAAADLSPEEF